jgi:cell division protein FtsL
MAKVKVKRFKGEKLLWFLIALVLVLTPLLHVYTKAELSESNIKVEKIKQNIDKQTNINESLSMQINELASLDKIREVASQEGLSYNNDNIKVIEDN